MKCALQQDINNNARESSCIKVPPNRHPFHPTATKSASNPTRSKSMRAIQINKYGGPEQLEEVVIPKPQARANQVVVKILAASLNPVDVKITGGAMREFIPLQFPWIPGRDFAGIVESGGADAVNFQPGDKVFGYSDIGGAYAEYIAIDVDKIALKPNRHLSPLSPKQQSRHLTKPDSSAARPSSSSAQAEPSEMSLSNWHIGKAPVLSPPHLLTASTVSAAMEPRKSSTTRSRPFRLWRAEWMWSSTASAGKPSNRLFQPSNQVEF
jgi:hypothetical protein